MPITIFNGQHFAQQREAELTAQVTALRQLGRTVTVAAVLFSEDHGSQLYTGLKQQAATRVGINYQVHQFSLTAPVSQILTTLQQLNQDPQVTGIIIQKPWRKTWLTVMNSLDPSAFAAWWRQLVQSIDPGKDVDGLHPATLAAISANTWQAEGKVLPATAKAVLSILESVGLLTAAKYIVIGKSDLLGKPLAAALRHRGRQVELLGKAELTARLVTGQQLHDADVVVTATGQAGLVTGPMLRPGAAVVDVGEPRPDVDRASVVTVASFLTPVPGGVGPVTVVSLLENAVQLAKWQATYS